MAVLSHVAWFGQGEEFIGQYVTWNSDVFFTGISWDDDTGRRFGGCSGSSGPVQSNFTWLSAVLSFKAKLSQKEDFGGEGAIRVEQVGLKTAL